MPRQKSPLTSDPCVLMLNAAGVGRVEAKGWFRGLSCSLPLGAAFLVASPEPAPQPGDVSRLRRVFLRAFLEAALSLTLFVTLAASAPQQNRTGSKRCQAPAGDDVNT